MNRNISDTHLWPFSAERGLPRVCTRNIRIVNHKKRFLDLFISSNCLTDPAYSKYGIFKYIKLVLRQVLTNYSSTHMLVQCAKSYIRATHAHKKSCMCYFNDFFHWFISSSLIFKNFEILTFFHELKEGKKVLHNVVKDIKNTVLFLNKGPISFPMAFSQHFFYQCF